MKVILAFYPGDQEQCFRLGMDFVTMGGCKGHDLILIHDVRCAQWQGMSDLFAKSFDTVENIPFTDHYNHWPESPNAIFGMIARRMTEPWLWLEPDCVPLKPLALDLIEKEYRDSGKLFLGDYVDTVDPASRERIPVHMSGVGVYPGNMINHAGLALIAGDVAWDMIAAPAVVPKMHRSQLIHHAWNHAPFTSWTEVEHQILKFKPDCALFHADKWHSLSKLIQERANLPVTAMRLQGEPAPAPFVALETAVAGTCDIFIKTFPGDYEWAKYCMRSVDKFCSGFRRIVIVAPDGGAPFPGNTPCENVIQPDREPGYHWQQSVKLHADQYTDADYVLFMDSDTIFARPVTPQTFFRDGKPMWLMTPFEQAREDQKRVWIPVMRDWMKKEPPYEFMRRHPFIFPRWLFDELRRFCRTHHGMELTDYIMQAKSFSEFNCAGFWAWQYRTDKFTWINTEKDEVPELTCLQKWSRGGLSDEVRAEFEEILSSGADDGPRPITRDDGPMASPLSQSLNGDSREALVRDTVAILKRLCTAPRHTGAVRKELKAQGVVK